MTLHGWRTQWAVGQGSFHAGSLSSGSASVHYVYDCGTQPGYEGALEREVDVAVGRLEGRVDLLYLSHFHRDHTSGVRRLLERAEVRRVVIPYTPASERVMALAASVRAGAPLDDWYLDLVSDPAGFFEAAGAGVTEVLPETDDGGFLPVEFPLQDNNSQSGFSAPLPGPQDVRHAAAAITEHGYHPLWLWLPWVPAGDRAAQTRFMKELAVRSRQSASALEEQLSRPDGLRHLADGQRSALRGAYMAVAPDLNLTSMALYSGPVPYGGPSGMAVGRFETPTPVTVLARPQLGWLGTGDALLRSPRGATRFSDAFLGFATGVATFVLPHHGSDRSFHEMLLEPFVHGTAFVASADTYRTWTHPGHRVARAALRTGHLIWVRGDERTRWTEHITADVP